jgi:hypothetical protein
MTSPEEVLSGALLLITTNVPEGTRPNTVQCAY